MAFNSKKPYFTLSKKPGFSCLEAGMSLIELSLIMIIMGVLLTASIFTGTHLVEKARLHKTLSQIEGYAQAISLFQQQYGALPGSFKKARETYGGNSEGSDTLTHQGLEAGTSPALAWEQLYESDLIKQPDKTSSSDVRYPSSSLGGGFSIGYIDRAAYLVLGHEYANTTQGSLLTKAQALYLQKNIDYKSTMHKGEDLSQDQPNDEKKKMYFLKIFLSY